MLLEEGTWLLDEKQQLINVRWLYSRFSCISASLLSSPEVLTWINTFSFLPSFYSCLLSFSAKLYLPYFTSAYRWSPECLDWGLVSCESCWTADDRWSATWYLQATACLSFYLWLLLLNFFCIVLSEMTLTCLVSFTYLLDWFGLADSHQSYWMWDGMGSPSLLDSSKDGGNFTADHWLLLHKIMIG